MGPDRGDPVRPPRRLRSPEPPSVTAEAPDLNVAGMRRLEEEMRPQHTNIRCFPQTCSQLKS
uniref:Uncharacterized protein n=1 Tax=Oryza brachyantha TaxID=4533 RepID=J3NC38_ORYBR